MKMADSLEEQVEELRDLWEFIKKEDYTKNNTLRRVLFLRIHWYFFYIMLKVPVYKWRINMKKLLRTNSCYNHRNNHFSSSSR